MQSLFLCYYLLITILLCIQTTLNLLLPHAVYTYTHIENKTYTCFGLGIKLLEMPSAQVVCQIIVM